MAAFQCANIVNGAHPFAATAGGGLNHDREADLLGSADQCLIPQPTFAAWDQRHATLAHRFTRRDLVAHRLDRLRAGANKGDTGIGASSGKFGPFGKEAIAWVDGIHTRFAGYIYNAVHAQVAIAAWCRTDAVGLVGRAHVQCRAISFGEDGDCVDAAFFTGSQNPDCDFTSVSDQHFLKHCTSFLAATGGR